MHLGSISRPFDVVVIGSGIGGLVSANLLVRQGYSVCVLEKNSQIGGALQTYARDKVLFDSGVHYIGGLAPGQTLYQIFKFLGVTDQLRLQKMDQEAFDKIIIEGDDREYVFAQGYERFIQRLIQDFPDEEKAIRSYCLKIQEICSKFPLYNLRTGGSAEEKAGVLETDTRGFIASLTNNPTLQAVLAGNNILYAGQGDKTPFYVHALILNSYIESSYKCLSGGSQLAKLLAQPIRAQGGVVRTRAEVLQIVEVDGQVVFVELADGSRVYAKQFISNLHPSKTLEMTQSGLIRPASRHRMKSLENSVSCFSLNLVLKKNAFPYFAHNYYYHKRGLIWSMTDYPPEDWPLGYALFCSASKIPGRFAHAVTIMTYMKYDEVQPWRDTFNTVSSKSPRGESYEAFKQAKIQRLLDTVALKFPSLPGSIQSAYASTPLSYRDYLGTEDGSMYGIVKDYKNPVKTRVAARTKLPNLYLTGQNLNLHGILGSTISGLVTCTELLGTDELVEKIKHA
jgi:all-trans-retinol 13,14-reductase